MNRYFLSAMAAMLLLTGLAGPLGAGTAQAQEGLIFIESQPDAAALYMGSLAYIRDELTIPAGMTAHIALPATTLRDSLVITEDGQRLRSYRYVTGGDTAAPQPSAIFTNFAIVSSGGGEGRPLVVTWDPPAGDQPRPVVLEYLATGAGWEPVYDLTILEESGADSQVMFGFDARISNTSLILDGVEIRLVAGMPGADSEYRPDMTATQANIGYAQDQAAAVGGPVAINHVYEVGALIVPQSEVVRHNLVYEQLEARRLLVWDARFGQRVDVIYKVQNSTDVPFVAGNVYAYQDALYVGQDHIEWTPAGSEGSVTVAGLSSVRVRRTESVENIGSFDDDRYRHTVTLAVTNHGGEDIDLTVLDAWNQAGQNYRFSHEPTRQGNNVLRWELTIPAGESVEVVYTFIVD